MIRIETLQKGALKPDLDHQREETMNKIFATSAAALAAVTFGLRLQRRKSPSGLVRVIRRALSTPV